ncbi:MAG: RNA polymerase-associated protein rapA [Candidatus Thiodiazotropha sp.]
MFKRCKLYQSMLLALIVPGTAVAEIDITGYLKNETAVFTRDGQVTGEADTMLDEEGHDKGDLMKFENSARIFLNGYIGDSITWHGDLNLIYDSEGVNDDYKGHKSYTQNDYLRELYFDTSVFDWDLRVGKQQVVWGTADGIKLLDIINPTDFRELNQNSMEDSRIPIWMINAERNIGDAGNIQFIISQVEENKIPGLNEDGDSGHPFIMKGVDSITGNVNGFLNVAPALANVAASFTGGATLGMIGGMPSPLGLVPTSGVTVDYFANSMLDLYDFDGDPTTTNDQYFLLPGQTAPGGTLLATMPGYIPLGMITQGGLQQGDPNGNAFGTNLMPVVDDRQNFSDQTYTVTQPGSAFEYMPNATFATFNTFNNCVDGDQDGDCQFGAPGSMDFFTGSKSVYEKDYPDDTDVNGGFRFKGYTDAGFNYSLNYFYHYSANPDIALSWHDAVTGEELTVQRASAGDFINNGTGAPGSDGVPDLPDISSNLGVDEVPGDMTMALPTTVLLHNSAGQYYGAYDPTAGFGSYTSNPTELHFTESLHRVNSFGASFDYALDTPVAPMVLRGEFLYDQDDKQPVVDKRLLAIGDLTNSLKMEDADYFKYVIGADINVFTNMMVSGQFIQYINLDYQDEKRTCTTQTGITFDCSRYTADFPTLSMTNGMNKGYEYKEFYSLFLSKPFGDSQEHRWNNIFIYEEGGGKWNRFDVEYSFSDTIIGSAEWNNYWGDENTTFGQFENSSNVQVGLKWIFE